MERLHTDLPGHIVDVFVYTVVLNLAIQYVPQLISETFTLSLFTAILLKFVLELIVSAKTRLKRNFRAASSRAGRVGAAVTLWLVLVGSKFLVIELTHLLFGDRVHLGGFWSVNGLIVVLMLARGGVRLLITPPELSPELRSPQPSPAPPAD
ncbi:hypothetical protein HH308_15205 [Gordonia sp. TBRC 11910]|uniref:Uncharacterized protein n=1 Tax=Gordonia asplenii TaxID=2725283 RepID=A0A848L214_9ACTN|nr:hypothetical protein [Gordonia asplenii]